MDTYDVIPASRDIGNTNGVTASRSSSTLKKTLKVKLSLAGSSSDSRGDGGGGGQASSTSPDHDKRRTMTGLLGFKGLSKLIPSAGVNVRKHRTDSRRPSSTMSERSVSAAADSVRTDVEQTGSTSDMFSTYATIPYDVELGRGVGGGGTRPEVDAVDVLDYENFVSRGNAESSADAVAYELDVPLPPPRRSTARQPNVAMSSSSYSETSPDIDVVGSSTSRDNDCGGSPSIEPVSALQWLQSIENSLFQMPSGSIERTTSADREPFSMHQVPPAASRQSSVSYDITHPSTSSFDDYVITNESEQRELQRTMMTSSTIATDVMRSDRPASLLITSPLAAQRSSLSDELAGVPICTYDGVKLYRKLPTPPISSFRPPCKPPKPPVVQLFWVQDWTRQSDTIQQD